MSGLKNVAHKLGSKFRAENYYFFFPFGLFTVSTNILKCSTQLHLAYSVCSYRIISIKKHILHK